MFFEEVLWRAEFCRFVLGYLEDQVRSFYGHGINVSYQTINDSEIIVATMRYEDQASFCIAGQDTEMQDPSDLNDIPGWNDSFLERISRFDTVGVNFVGWGSCGHVAHATALSCNRELDDRNVSCVSFGSRKSDDDKLVTGCGYRPHDFFTVNMMFDPLCWSRHGEHIGTLVRLSPRCRDLPRLICSRDQKSRADAYLGSIKSNSFALSQSLRKA